MHSDFWFFIVVAWLAGLTAAQVVINRKIMALYRIAGALLHNPAKFMEIVELAKGDKEDAV